MKILVDSSGNIVRGPMQDDLLIKYDSSTRSIVEIEIKAWPLFPNGEPYLKRDLRWNGTEIVIKSEARLANELYRERVEHLRDYISRTWMQTDRTASEIRNQFKTVKDSMKKANTREDVKTIVSNFKTWLNEDID